MGTLGYNIFESLTHKNPEQSLSTNDSYDDELLLFMERHSRKSKHLIKAQCKQTNEGFVVLKGSYIEVIDSDTIPISIKENRQHANIDKNNRLQEDTLFKSPSYAAAFVIGGHANGWTEWKDKNGRTLKEIETID